MMRRFLAALGTIAVLLGAPAAAQDEQPALPPEAAREWTRKLFPTDPLTPEEEARLPAAQVLTDLILPPGTYGAKMAKSLQTTMQPLLRLATLSSVDTTFVAEQLGLPEEQWTAVPRRTKLDLARMLDPAFGARARAGFAALSAAMEPALATIEPSMRQAITEIHAQRFTEAQMADIAAFFATPTGSIYAEEWLGAMMDPRMTAVSMEAMPRMFTFITQAQQQMEGAMEPFGERGRYADLPDAQRDEVAALLGMTRTALEDGISAAAAAEAEAEAESRVRVQELLQRQPTEP